MLPADRGVTELLTRGRIEIEGRLVDASNATLFCEITGGDAHANCVYKPVSGERALWDFPDGTLAGREVASYLVCQAAGLSVIPPTVLRDGPFGPGMVQLWIETKEGDDLVDVLAPVDVPQGWRTVLHAHDRFGDPAVLVHADHSAVRLMAALDVVLNNADRKGGHVLHGTDGNVYGVDHGICLHVEHKLRTVLWGWMGERLPEDVVGMLKTLRAGLDDVSQTLAEHITRGEIRALRRRLHEFLDTDRFPSPEADYRAIPWPAF
ncbi:SCO1664 family protein [Actinophytocola oryzae]|uniref:Putative repeat protein (TIGR03843 family) n=1 Tax=Actinophytocola oryzae TaxID=502181 RepID=A0A4R7V2Q3_9PSEU|nr:SCO1664 family protein [Actinophytocola oryzae]TDV43643.1 putative repeat protein (TIGR03843 family) [Actinophytocola oryzae]